MISFSDCNRAVTHARGSAEGSQGCREDAHDDLDNGLPSFFLHSALFLMVNVTDSIILARIPRIYTAFSFIQPCLSKRAESGARRPRVWRQSASLKRAESGTRRPRVWHQSAVACDFTLGPDLGCKVNLCIIIKHDYF